MRKLGNIIWFVFGGFWLGLAWSILGILLCITVIGIPLGIQCFKAAKLTFFPFGKSVKTDFDKHPIANVIWAVLCGWEIAIGYLIAAVLCCVTIVGIPMGLQSLKLMKLAFIPFGASVNKKGKKK